MQHYVAAFAFFSDMSVARHSTSIRELDALLTFICATATATATTLVAAASLTDFGNLRERERVREWQREREGNR